MTKRIFFSTSFLLVAIGVACSGGANDSLCGKAAKPLAGIVLLEAKDAEGGPEILNTFESELAAECTAKKLEESTKDALQCYHDNKGERGYFIFKKCPEEPGKALVAAVVAKHGDKKEP